MPRVRLNAKITVKCGLVLALCLLAFVILTDESERSSPNTPASPRVAAWLHKLSSIPTPDKSKRHIDRYWELLPGAETGDRDAQYELAKVYEFCSFVPGNILMTALKFKGTPPENLRMFERDRALCEGFEAAYEDWDKPRDARKHWMSEASLQDHPIALTESSIKSFGRWGFRSGRSPRAEHAADLAPTPVKPPSDDEVYFALSHGVRHPQLLGYAVRLGYRFFRMFRAEDYMAEQAVGSFKRGPLREAWSILRCHYSASCSVQKHLEGMSHRLSVDEVEETVQTVMNLHGAIIAEDWDELGLSGTG